MKSGGKSIKLSFLKKYVLCSAESGNFGIVSCSSAHLIPLLSAALSDVEMLRP